MDLFWKKTKRWNETILEALASLIVMIAKCFLFIAIHGHNGQTCEGIKRIQSPRSLVGIRSPHIKQEKDTKAPYKDKLVVSKQRDVGNDRHRQG